MYLYLKEKLMSVIRKTLALEGSQYFRQHLKLINTFLPVTLAPKEIEVLAEFLALPENVVADDRFNTYARKLVMANLSMSPASLSNNLGSMVKKGYLKRSEFSKNLSINPLVIPQTEKQGYQFSLVNTQLHEGS